MTPNFGKPGAAKRGRNPRFPFVPVIDHGDQATGRRLTRTEQILGKAFETRDQAVAYAAAVIQARQDSFAARLADPRHRALREQYGFPR